MKRVTGIGGVFLRARNQKRLAEWYRKHLGIPVEKGAAVFAWRGFEDPKRKGHTIWALFEKNTEYFGGKSQQAMVNYRVRNLRKTLDGLSGEGVRFEKRVEESGYGNSDGSMIPRETRSNSGNLRKTIAPRKNSSRQSRLCEALDRRYNFQPRTLPVT